MEWVLDCGHKVYMYTTYDATPLMFVGLRYRCVKCGRAEVSIE